MVIGQTEPFSPCGIVLVLGVLYWVSYPISNKYRFNPVIRTIEVSNASDNYAVGCHPVGAVLMIV